MDTLSPNTGLDQLVMFAGRLSPEGLSWYSGKSRWILGWLMLSSLGPLTSLLPITKSSSTSSSSTSLSLARPFWMSGHMEEVFVATEAVEGNILGMLLLETNCDTLSPLLKVGEEDVDLESTMAAEDSF